jgi:hypothetical protein
VGLVSDTNTFRSRPARLSQIDFAFRLPLQGL